MPKVIDNFVLEEKIGSGQFGDVYKGYNQQTKQQVAIKTIKRDTIKGKFYQLLENQIKVLKTCDNLNIIKLYAIKKTANHFYLMLEYCNGGDMLAYVRKHPNLSDDQIIKFTCEILNGFQTLVKHRIMHRDFKLANILLHNGSVKIADFGFAKLLNSQDYTTTILGSPLNMAPEVLGNNRYNSKADIWSIGACIFEIITGKPPYVASNMVDLLKLIKSSQPPYPKNIHPLLKEVLKKMLVVDPKRRISWNDLFSHPINSYLQNKMQKQINLQLVQDQSLLLNTSKYYLKKNLVIDSTQKINENQEVNNYLLNVIQKGQKDGEFQPNNMKKKAQTNIQESQPQTSKQHISDSQLHECFRKNSKKILYYRNIYAFLAKVADDIVKRTDIKEFQLAAYALGQKILGMISWLNELCQMKESPLQGLEHWESYIKRVQFKQIRNYINKQYQVFEIFNQSIEPLIKSKIVQGNYANQQTAKAILIQGITNQNYQQLLLSYVKQLAKKTSSQMLKRKQTEGFVDEWVHLQQLMIARKVNEIFSSKNEDFDFKQFYTQYESISLENVLLKFESMYQNA